MDRLDINAASRDDLIQIRGIADHMADKIIRYRAEHGEFSHIEQLDDVPGISEARMKVLREMVFVKIEQEARRAMGRRKMEGKAELDKAPGKIERGAAKSHAMNVQKVEDKGAGGKRPRKSLERSAKVGVEKRGRKH